MQGIKDRRKTSEPIFTLAPLLVGIILLITTGLCLAASSTDKPAATTQPSKKQLTDARAVLQQFLDPHTPEEKQNIEKLIADLGDKRWKVRKSATEKLSRLDIRAVPVISRAAKSEDAEVASRAKQVLKVLQVKADNISRELNPAIDTLAAGGDKKIAAMLIELLNYPKHSIRYTAEYGLRRITGENFGYNSYDDPDERAKAVKKWRQWWEKNQADFIPTKPKPFGILICNSRGMTLTAVSVDGKAAWSHKFGRMISCAAGLPNGNVIVGSMRGTPNIEGYDADFKPVWNCRNLGFRGFVQDVQCLPNGNRLIAYSRAGHVSEITPAGKVVWQKKGLREPVAVQRLTNGNTLITETTGKRVIEVNRTGKIVWKKTRLRYPYDAARLANGNVLIAQFDKNQVFEMNRAGKIVWEKRFSGFNATPTGVCRLPDGTTAIINRSMGAFIVDCDGRIIRHLLKFKTDWGKIRMAPAAVLKQKKSAVSTQPANIPLPAGRG